MVPFLCETIFCGIGTVSLSPFKFLVLASDGSYAVSTGFLKLLKRLSEIMGEFFVLLGGFFITNPVLMLVVSLSVLV